MLISQEEKSLVTEVSKKRKWACDCIDADKESSLSHTRVMRNEGQQSIMKRAGSFKVSSL